MEGKTPTADHGQTSEGLFALAPRALRIVLAFAAAGAAVYVVGSVTLWLQLWQSPWPTYMGVEHQPRSVLVALGLKGILLVLAIFGISLMGLLFFRWLIRQYTPVRDFILSHGRIAVGLVLCVCTALVVGLSFVSWQWLGAAIAFSVFVACALYACTDLSLSSPVAAAAAVALALAGIFAAASFQLGRHATVQAVQFRQVPRQLAALSPVPQYLARAPFPYFGDDGSAFYIGAVRSYIPGDFPYNFCPDEPRIIAQIPRESVDIWYLPHPITLSHNTEPPGSQLWDWIVGTKHTPQPYPPGKTKQRRTQERHQCQIMAHNGDLPGKLPLGWALPIS